MPYFAKLTPNNKVERVVVIGDQDSLDANGNESEEAGIAFCKKLYGSTTQWLQTFQDGSVRGRYATAGDTYDPELDLFIPAQPFPSWTLDLEALTWNPPVPYPSDGEAYVWAEEAGEWQTAPPPEPEPEPEPEPPDYYAFWDALLISGVYQSIRAQALTNPAVLVACTEFVAAIGDAKAGRPNVPAIQMCIWLLLQAASFTPEELAELESLLAVGGLQDIYRLIP